MSGNGSNGVSVDRDNSSEQSIGVLLASVSSIFIGASFIIKKKGLRRAGSKLGQIRAGSGGYSYLKEPLWWTGLLCMVFGEAANFAAYAFSPAIIVTPLGALSILVSAVLAHIILKERLNRYGILGCILCVAGTVAIVLHAPEEKDLGSIVDIWNLAMQPYFLTYIAFALVCVYVLVWKVPLEVQKSRVAIYVAICSLVGSLSVVSCKALGMALKMTLLEKNNQMVYPQTYLFLLIVISAVMTQMNYLNKALDLFNTAIVTPMYYVMFTTMTILASSIMFPEEQETWDLIAQLTGFFTIICGTYLLHNLGEDDNNGSRLSLRKKSPSHDTELV